MSEIREIRCHPCGGVVLAKLVSASEIYAHRYDLIGQLFYQCPDCRNYVSCDPPGPDGDVPAKGTITDWRGRRLRQQAHVMLETFAKSWKIPQDVVYKMVGAELGVDGFRVATFVHLQADISAIEAALRGVDATLQSHAETIQRLSDYARSGRLQMGSEAIRHQYVGDRRVNRFPEGLSDGND